MAMINIGASNAGDQFYRYKMPAIQSKIEGRGNGIKTNVTNLVEVSKALARPPMYTLKFLGNDLGAQTTFNEKEGRAIVNGAHDAGKLAQSLESFIKRFVQCFSCGNPETMIEITKRETIHLKCKAANMVTVVADKMADAAIEDESSEEEEDPRVSKLRAYAAKNDAVKTAEYLVSDALGVESKEMGVLFLLEAVFDEDEAIPPQIKAKKDYLSAACPDAALQRALLCAFERYVTETATSGFKAFSLILNQLYEFDLIEEDVIKAWNEDVDAASCIDVEPKVAQAVRKQAAKFIDWLDESEDEDSD